MLRAGRTLRLLRRVVKLRDTGQEAFRVTGFIQPRVLGYAHVDRVYAPHEQRDTTRLWVWQQMVMSDGRREYEEHLEAIRHAHGRVLVNGLGLGCYVKAILAKPEVEVVEVVEIDADVLRLIGPYYSLDPRVRLIHADAFEQAKQWPRGSRWDCVWSDVWPSVDVADLEAHARLLRSYGGRAGWQGAWIHEELQRKRRLGYVSAPEFARQMSERYGVDVHIGAIPEWA